MEVSLRYTPVTGRLHTRYAPVRRSSAEYCYSLLPLDLHVLSLPLAFILSQDQTLHCKNCSFTFIDSSSCPPHTLIQGLTHAISIFSSVSMYCRFPPRFSTTPVFRRKRMQRYNHFPFRQNIFSKKITRPSVKRCQTGCCGRKKIFASPRFPLRKTTQKGNSPPENRKKHAPFCIFGTKPEYFAMNQRFNPQNGRFQACVRATAWYTLSSTYPLPINYHRSSIVLRLFFDRSSIVLRFGSKYYRRTIGLLSKNGRSCGGDEWWFSRS